MNRLFRLGPVLRARKAQEDAARGAVIQSPWRAAGRRFLNSAMFHGPET